MLAAKRGQYEKKIIPTINVLCTNSLKGWSIMRCVCADYGK